MKPIDFMLTNSLEKVFSASRPKEQHWKQASLFQNEQFSFQLAYRCHGAENRTIKLQIKADGTLKKSLSTVKHVPSDLPAYPDRHDEHYLSTEPGLYPDLLMPVTEGEIELEPNGWQSLWIDIEPSSEAAGKKKN